MISVPSGRYMVLLSSIMVPTRVELMLDGVTCCMVLHLRAMLGLIKIRPKDKADLRIRYGVGTPPYYCSTAPVTSLLLHAVINEQIAVVIFNFAGTGTCSPHFIKTVLV